MAIKRDESKSTKFEAKELEIIRASDQGKVIFFDMKINGITICGMKYIEYKNKEGKEGTMISYPSTTYKDKDGNDAYSNIVWFPISKELKDKIEELLTAKLNKK